MHIVRPYRMPKLSFVTYLLLTLTCALGLMIILCILQGIQINKMHAQETRLRLHLTEMQDISDDMEIQAMKVRFAMEDMKWNAQRRFKEYLNRLYRDDIITLKERRQMLEASGM